MRFRCEIRFHSRRVFEPKLEYCCGFVKKWFEDPISPADQSGISYLIVRIKVLKMPKYSVACFRGAYFLLALISSMDGITSAPGMVTISSAIR